MTADTEQARVEPKARVFISYSRKDMAFAECLEAALAARGFEPLIDRSEIYAFEDWWKRIETLIGHADTVVFVLSPDAVASEVALKEISYAATLNKRFAPIVCHRVDDAAVPEILRRLNFIFFDDLTSFEANADALAVALQTDIGWVRRHTEFGEAAHRWTTTGRPVGLLLRPPILQEAEYWMAYRPHGASPPTADTQKFIAESRKNEVAAQVRRRQVQALIYVLFLSIIAGLFGWINQDYIKKQLRWFSVTRPYMVSQVRPYVLTKEFERALKPGASFKECATNCPEMIVVPAGSFKMGSPDGKGHVGERPQHEVKIARPFAVSKYEVTFADWDACAAYGNCDPDVSDSGFGRDQQPVVNVSWDDAQTYATWFSRMTGKTYRLLSEAEYEYAARAGTQTEYPWGDELGVRNANCLDCGSKWDRKQTAPVGSFAPNQFGLYDMAGNVFVWLKDCVHSNYSGAPTDGSPWIKGGNCTNRIVRGGAWDREPEFLRSAFRGWRGNTAVRFNNRGFRLGRTLIR